MRLLPPSRYATGGHRPTPDGLVRIRSAFPSRAGAGRRGHRSPLGPPSPPGSDGSGSRRLAVRRAMESVRSVWPSASGRVGPSVGPDVRRGTTGLRRSVVRRTRTPAPGRVGPTGPAGTLGGGEAPFIRGLASAPERHRPTVVHAVSLPSVTHRGGGSARRTARSVPPPGGRLRPRRTRHGRRSPGGPRRPRRRFGRPGRSRRSRTAGGPRRCLDRGMGVGPRPRRAARAVGRQPRGRTDALLRAGARRRPVQRTARRVRHRTRGR